MKNFKVFVKVENELVPIMFADLKSLLNFLDSDLLEYDGVSYEISDVVINTSVLKFDYDENEK